MRIDLLAKRLKEFPYGYCNGINFQTCRSNENIGGQAMRLIDADALKSKVQAQEWKRDPAVMLALDWIYMLINEQPTIDAVPVVRGEWKPIFKGADTCECSVCKSEGFSDSDFGFIATPYCPNCGAEMEVEP